MLQVYRYLTNAIIVLAVIIGTRLPVTAQAVVADSVFEVVSTNDPLHARTGSKVLYTDVALGNKISYQKLLPVQAGQQLITEVHAFYEKKSNARWLKVLLGAGRAVVTFQPALTPSNLPNETNLNRSTLIPFVGAGFALGPRAFKRLFQAVPRAALQYNFYAKDSSYVRSVTRLVTKAARDQWQLLRLDEEVDQDGFVEIIIINESRRSVWFDDFTVTVLADTMPVEGQVANSESSNASSTYNLYNVFIRSFAPPGSFDGYNFEDDGRGFTVDLAVTSRIAQDYTVSPDGVDPFLSGGYPQSDETYTTSGDIALREEPTGYARLTSFTRPGGDNRVRVETFFEGSNPFFPFNGAPDIEVGTQITFTENYQKTRLSLSVTANTKRFPAMEVFIADVDGNRVFLVADGAYGSPIDLATRDKFYHTITATISINIATNGTFLSVYRTGQVAQTYSITQWNQQFTSRNAGPIR